MSNRIVFELFDSPEQKPEIWEDIKKNVHEFGGEILSVPSGKPPYLITASFKDEAVAKKAVLRLRKTKGVGRADIDAWRKML